jgi:hypothetical protein
MAFLHQKLFIFELTGNIFNLFHRIAYLFNFRCDCLDAALFLVNLTDLINMLFVFLLHLFVLIDVEAEGICGADLIHLSIENYWHD